MIEIPPVRIALFARSGPVVQGDWYSVSGFPWWLLLVLLCGAGILAFWFYRKRVSDRRARQLWVLRFAAIAITILALADLGHRQTQIDLPDLVIAIDVSESSNLPAALPLASSQGEVTRLQAIRSALMRDRRLEQLARRYQLVLYPVWSDASQPVAEGDLPEILGELVADKPASRIGDSIEAILQARSGQETAAILLFSDGATTGGTSLQRAGQTANAEGVPVFCVGVGGTRPPANVRLLDVQCPGRVRVGEPLEVRVSIASESSNGRACDVIVRDQDTGEVLGRKKIPFTSDQFQRELQFVVRSDRPQSRVLAVHAEPLPGEADLTDNRLERRVQVVDGKTRVLIVQDFPTPWYRFLKATLGRAVDPATGQPALEVSTLLQQAAIDYRKTDRSSLERFPLPERLAEFDLVVMGDARLDAPGEQGGLTDDDLDSLARYVRHESGNVVFVPGPLHFQDLAGEEAVRSLLPWSPLETFRFSNTGAPAPATSGLLFPEVANRFAATRILRDQFAETPTRVRFRPFAAPRLTPSAIVLAWFVADSSGTPDNRSAAAMTLQKIGTGTVITHFTDELYRLKYRSTINLYEQYWIRLVTDLAQERLQNRDRVALLTTGSPQYAVGDRIELQAEVFDPLLVSDNRDQVEVLLSDSDRQTARLVLTRDRADPESRRYRSVVEGLTAGTYKAVLLTNAVEGEAIEAEFEVSGDSGELRQLVRQRAALEKLAAASGGRYFEMANVAELWEQLPEGRQRQTGRQKSGPIWLKPFVPLLFALLVIGLVSLEWILRRRWRME